MLCLMQDVWLYLQKVVEDLSLRYFNWAVVRNFSKNFLAGQISSGIVDWFEIPFEYVQKLIRKYNLREKGQGQHQTYALGIKEVYMQHSTQESSIFLLIFAHWKVYCFPGCTNFLLFFYSPHRTMSVPTSILKIFPLDIWIMWKHWHHYNACVICFS